MGFFDSIKTGLSGIGSFVGNIFETAAPIILPSLVEVGTQALAQKLGVGPRAPAPVFQTGGFGGNLDPLFGQRGIVPSVRRPLNTTLGQTFDRFSGVSPVSTVSRTQLFTGSGVRGGSQMARAIAHPGGAPVRQVGLVDDLQQAFPGLLGSGNGASVPGALRVNACGTVSFRSLVRAVTPDGRETFYRNVGKPILFSGDAATVKRVTKIATKLGRSTGRRRPR